MRFVIDLIMPFITDVRVPEDFIKQTPKIDAGLPVVQLNNKCESLISEKGFEKHLDVLMWKESLLIDLLRPVDLD